MNSQEAHREAKFNAQSTRIKYDVIEINGDYFSFISGTHTGNVIKTYSHEDFKDLAEVKPGKSKKIQSVPELLNTTDKDILPDTGDE